MGKKIKLGSTEPCIFGIKIKNITENGKNEMLANINGYNIEFGGWTSTPNSVELNGLEVEMDMDELSQGVAYLNEATEGKTTAVDGQEFRRNTRRRPFRYGSGACEGVCQENKQ